MTEQQAKAQQPQQDPQLIAIKQALLKSVYDAYQSFVGSIQNLPGSRAQKQQAYINFDQGFMWLEKSILSAPMQVGDPIKKPVAEGEPNPAQPESSEAKELVAEDGC